MGVCGTKHVSHQMVYTTTQTVEKYNGQSNNLKQQNNIANYSDRHYINPNDGIKFCDYDHDGNHVCALCGFCQCANKYCDSLYHFPPTHKFVDE